jgi:transposase
MVFNPNSRLGFQARICKEGSPTMEEHSIISVSGSQSNGLFWGVDVASEKLDLGCHGLAAVLTFENSAAGIEQLLARIPEESAALIVVEATGGYETPLVAALADARLPIALINPRQLRAFATAVGELAKTDAIDARIIARFAHDVRPEVRPLPSESQRFFADLAARRRQLIETRTAERNRRRQTNRAELIASIDSVLEVLDKQIGALERQLAELITTNDQWRQRDQILQSISGVAAATSHTLIADLPELGRLDHKQVAKLVGVAPLNRDSGKFRGRRAIGGGRSTVRAALYMAAFNAIRCNPQIREFYLRLRNAGKCYKVAITACMRKLLTILNALVRDNILWRKPDLTS